MKTADEVIQDISDTLSEASGEFIEDIANRVLSQHVRYVEDSMFEVKSSSLTTCFLCGKLTQDDENCEHCGKALS